MEGADVVLHLNQGLTEGNDWEINNTTFFMPSVPVLLQILSGNTNANSLLPKGSVYDLPYNSVIEVHINGGFSHPFHLHGVSSSLYNQHSQNIELIYFFSSMLSTS